MAGKFFHTAHPHTLTDIRLALLTQIVIFWENVLHSVLTSGKNERTYFPPSHPTAGKSSRCRSPYFSLAPLHFVRSERFLRGRGRGAGRGYFLQFVVFFCIILAGSFSAVSKQNFARKCAFDSICQALQDLHTFAPLQSQNFSKKSV